MPPLNLGCGLPSDWRPWRDSSRLGGRRPTREELTAAAQKGALRQDVLPFQTDAKNRGYVRVLIVGINPSPWTALVNAPFAGTSNRFWKSLFQAGMTPYRVEAVTGFQPQDETMLAQQGLGIINLVSRATVRASELSSSELRSGGTRLIQRVSDIRPDAVAIVGVTAFRTAYSLPGATIGKQSPARVFGQADTEENIVAWPAHTPLWVLPNPSGLNAHETVESLANKWREVWRSVPT